MKKMKIIGEYALEYQANNIIYSASETASYTCTTGAAASPVLPLPGAAASPGASPWYFEMMARAEGDSLNM